MRVGVTTCTNTDNRPCKSIEEHRVVAAAEVAGSAAQAFSLLRPGERMRQCASCMLVGMMCMLCHLVSVGGQ